jgi:hypothetical protein
MTQDTLEDYLNSDLPPISLAEFRLKARGLPDALFEATVRHVGRHRSGVHEYILLHCAVILPRTQQATIVYFRLERKPSERGLLMLSGKSSLAVDTVWMNTKLAALQDRCEARGYFVFNPEDNPPTPLRLKHVLEMYECLARGSASYYSLYGTNCRWVCYGLLECLRECESCYKGIWMRCKQDTIHKQEKQVANQAKEVYLKEKHGNCCCPSRSGSMPPPPVTRAAVPGVAATNLEQMANQAQNGSFVIERCRSLN